MITIKPETVTTVENMKFNPTKQEALLEIHLAIGVLILMLDIVLRKETTKPMHQYSITIKSIKLDKFLEKKNKKIKLFLSRFLLN